MSPQFRRIAIALALFLAQTRPGTLTAQWKSIGAITSIERTADGVKLTTQPEGRLDIAIVSPNVFHVHFSPHGNPSASASWAVISKETTRQNFSMDESRSTLSLRTGELTLVIQRSPCRLTFQAVNGQVINRDDSLKGISWTNSDVEVWKEMPAGEEYFGFGEKSTTFLKRGKAMSMWNSDIPAYRADTDPLYEDIPFFYGFKDGRCYGIFFDNTCFSSFNMGKENPGQYSFGATGGDLDYYFIYGPKPAQVHKAFTALTGTMPLPPRWALGYQQCRWSYYPESRVREIAHEFRSRNIPCDVIYLDIHYMDGYRCFTWDSTRFPDPGKMTGDLSRDGFKIVTIVDPGIKRDSTYWVYQQGVLGNHFVKYRDGTPFIGEVWPGKCAFPDFTNDDARKWWGTLYKSLTDVGIRGFWNDMNEPSVFNTPNKTFDLDVVHDDRGQKTDHRRNHNIYGMQMARGTYEGLLALRPDERPFVLTRANYAGGQRYAAAWTGDNVSSWEHLEMAIPMCLGLSVSGQPFVGSDIGGFIGMPSGELYARWLQLGIFTPLMRSHAEIASPNKEPWVYGTEFETVNRKSIELRYKLLPYIYTQFYKASTEGVPIMRPVVFDFPDDPDALRKDHEFLFGDALLVAPVLTPQTILRELQLPGGMWYDYWTKKTYPARSYVKVDAPIDRIPFFVKAGSVLPTQQVVQYTDQASPDPLTLEVYPDSSGRAAGVSYEDDGISFAYKKGHYCKREFKLTRTPQTVDFTISDCEGTYKPSPRRLSVKIYEIPSVKRIRVDKKILQAMSEIGGKDSWDGWQWDSAHKTLEIRIRDSFKFQTIDISL